ncbi:MAG: DUF4175 domain-containing protein [Lachnospiraceae bacterium]|nr:DUF4175 domain-containing protein [Lachnospiraceae bacterium]
MSMMIGTRNSDVTRIELRNRDGSYAGTMTVSKPRKKTTSKSNSVSMSAKKKYKKLNYNFRRLSNQILQTKTSINAKQLTTKSKFQIADLRMKLISGDYNYIEIHNALTHAEKIARVAKKRLKNLQEEENIEKTGRKGMTDPEEMKEKDDEKTEILDTSGMTEEEMQRLMQELQEEMERIKDELEEAMKSAENLMEEFTQASSQEMDPHDLELLKKKHRAEEIRDIMKADLEYLKAVFDKLAKDKQSGSGGVDNSSDSSSDGSGSGNASGVSLELGGVDIPVETAEAPIEVAGTNVDVTA